jgi:hypothetical protein
MYMSTLETVIHLGRDTGERERRATEKRERVAERIAGRQLTHIQAEKYANVVRGGRFGIDHTKHDPEVYELVAQHLLKNRIEIKVDEISQVVDQDPGNARHPVMHVLSVVTLKDWPKHIAQTPTEHPRVYAKGLGPLGPEALYVVEQIYPPEPPELLVA